MKYLLMILALAIICLSVYNCEKKLEEKESIQKEIDSLTNVKLRLEIEIKKRELKRLTNPPHHKGN